MSTKKTIKITFNEKELETLKYLMNYHDQIDYHSIIRFLISSQNTRVKELVRKHPKGVTSETSSKMTKLERTQEMKKRLQEMPAKEAEEYISSLNFDGFSDIDRLEFPDNPGCFDMCHHAITDDPERGRIFEIQLYHMNDPEKKIISRREQCSFEDLLKALVSKKLI